MPQVYLDGNKIDIIDSGKDSTVGELVSVVEKEMTDLRRFILELWIDGSKLEETARRDFFKEPISRFSDLEFKTVSIETLALEGVDMVHEYMRAMRENVDDCAVGIRAGEPNAEAVLSAIVEGMAEMVKTTDALKKGVKKYRINLFRENPDTYCKPLLGYIDTLVALLESGETTLIADTLECEVKPLLDEMEAALFFRAA
ncbi:MAG: hypothetical protein ACE5EI_06050 [Thermodesulfobacteriota bacterium]